MRVFFERELKELKIDLVKMANLVEVSLEKAIIALKDQDVNLAKEIIHDDDYIDAMEESIEKQCITIIARQSPIAHDLRVISSTLKIITDLERIGDHSTAISEITIRLADTKYVRPLIDITEMAEKARNMFKDSVTSFINTDVELAKEICSRDDEVDDLFNKIILELVSLIKEDTNNVQQLIDLIFVVKYLERIGDHATNISEWVVYNATGNHKHLQHPTEYDIKE